MKKVEENELANHSFVKVKWVDGMRFVATDSSGHSVVMDASKQSGGEGSGFSPMLLLLIALGGCTGMDVVHIMRRQRQPVDDLEIVVSGKRVEEPPQVYNNISVEYKVRGKDIKENAVLRAIQLSEDKYCSVGAMLGAKARLTGKYSMKQK